MATTLKKPFLAQNKDFAALDDDLVAHNSNARNRKSKMMLWKYFKGCNDDYITNKKN